MPGACSRKEKLTPVKFPHFFIAKSDRFLSAKEIYWFGWKGVAPGEFQFLTNGHFPELELQWWKRHPIRPTHSKQAYLNHQRLHLGIFAVSDYSFKGKAKLLSDTLTLGIVAQK